tara:strand:- start:66 stop:245 length:180 start_codon:yes stop_codon:yes gene_type:complete
LKSIFSEEAEKNKKEKKEITKVAIKPLSPVVVGKISIDNSRDINIPIETDVKSIARNVI